MPVICIHALNTDSGSTTPAVNMAYTLRNLGCRVLLVDLDVKDELQLYARLKHPTVYGCSAPVDRTGHWLAYIHEISTNIFILPYGNASPEQQQQFEYNLYNNETFLINGLGTAYEDPNLVIIFDMPSNYDFPVKALVNLANIHVMSLLAEASSLQLVRQLEKRISFGERFNNNHGHVYVLTKCNIRDEMSNRLKNFI